MLYQLLTFDTITAAGVKSVIADFLNGPQYQNARYTPNVAPRRPSSLAGASPYAEVEDEITLDVTGTTYGACVRNAETLFGILDQAAEWAAGVNTTAIQLRVKAPCSDASELTAMVLGPAPGEPPGDLSPEETVAAPGSRWVLKDITIRFVRRGRLLAIRETAVQSVSTGNPTVQTLTWSTDQGRVYAPVGISIIGPNVATDSLYGFLLTASAASAIQLLDATAVAPSAPFTNVNDSADFPYNGTNVRRYTPTGTGGNSFNVSTALALNGYEQYAIVAAVRNNSASVPFLIRPSITQNNGVSTVTTAGATTVIEAGYTDPQLISLGVISVRGTSSAVDCTLTLFCQAVSTSGSPTLDISHVALLALDAPGARLIALPNAVRPDALDVYPAEVMNASRVGFVGSNLFTFANATPGFPYRGDIEIGMRDSSLYVCFLRTDADNWVMVDSGSKANVTFRAYRRRVFLSPQ